MLRIRVGQRCRSSGKLIHCDVIAVQHDPLTASQLLRELCADMYVSPLELEDMVSSRFSNIALRNGLLTKLCAGQQQLASGAHTSPLPPPALQRFAALVAGRSNPTD